MGWLKPAPPPYDPLVWRNLPWQDRLKQACQAWAVQGYGAPYGVYFLYLLKVLAFVGVWCFFCSFSPGLGDVTTITGWCFEPVAYQKAVVWSLLFEVVGLGCASGPLTARYWPPFAACLHFAWPGTTKLPFVRGFPLLGGNRRTVIEAALYGAFVFFLLRLLLSPTLTSVMFAPCVVLLGCLGLSDKTIFLAARAEHYGAILVCFLFADAWLAGAQAVQLAIWGWAGVSKLTHHFPTAVCVMTSNSPSTPFRWLRTRMYRSYPDDLRPSALARRMAHMGTVLELGFPVLLAFGGGGWATWLGLALMLGFHTYITSNFPMAVPIEWNVHVVYGGLFLFGHHAGASFTQLDAPWLAGFLLVVLVAIPLLGNFWPRGVSFLCSMRYYAGNWPYSVWLFRGESWRRLERLQKAADWVPRQLERFYDEARIVGLLSKLPAFRAMHLQGRALVELLPKAAPEMEQYTYVDGELVAGMVLGWNFGDGHLHQLQLLEAVQAQCGFEPGELRCVFVESQPLFGAKMAWQIADAADGVMDSGEVAVQVLRERQPWG